MTSYYIMWFVQDVLPIIDRFGLIDLRLLVDFCMILNIFTIKSTSREMRGWPVRMAMPDLLAVQGLPISLALYGHYVRSKQSMQ